MSSVPLPLLSSACPCGGLGERRKPRAWESCCGRYIGASSLPPAPDAESLMRSRYSAFVLQQADYLLATWHVRTRPAQLALDDGAQWLGLEVRGQWSAGLDRAEVEFVARYRIAGRAVRIHERSRFIREGGRWFYVDGV